MTTQLAEIVLIASIIQISWGGAVLAADTAPPSTPPATSTPTPAVPVSATPTPAASSTSALTSPAPVAGMPISSPGPLPALTPATTPAASTTPKTEVVKLDGVPITIVGESIPPEEPKKIIVDGRPVDPMNPLDPAEEILVPKHKYGPDGKLTSIEYYNYEGELTGVIEYLPDGTKRYLINIDGKLIPVIPDNRPQPPPPTPEEPKPLIT